MKKQELEQEAKLKKRESKEPGDIKESENKMIEEGEAKKDIEKIKEPVRITREERARQEDLTNWIPKTQLGKDVIAGKIKDIEEIFQKNLKVLEHQIVDMLVPNLESDLLHIGQAKGKFGGGKRRPWRQTQKKTSEGNVPSFGCMVVVGDKKGYVGLGYGKSKETVPAKQKALRKSKLNLFKVRRGCGSFDCVCNEPHSIPFKVSGKVGSSEITLIPAPKGTGLAIENECKKILRLAGIKDVYSKTKGQTKTKHNLAKACIKALEKLNKII